MPLNCTKDSTQDTVTTLKMGEWGWVDDGLSKLGLSLDLEPHDIPFSLRGNGPLSVSGLMQQNITMDSQSLCDALNVTDDTSSLKVGKYEGNSVVTEVLRMTVPSSTFSLQDFHKLTMDHSMLQVAKLWDTTFVNGEFTHTLLRQTSNECLVCRNVDEIKGKRVEDVAKIMRWVFNLGPGFVKREVVSVYVVKRTDLSFTALYFPVKSTTLFPLPSIFSLRLCRARLMVPCFDRATFVSTNNNGGGGFEFEHQASSDLHGWMRKSLVSSFWGKRSFLNTGVTERDHFRKLFAGKIPDFDTIQSQDETSMVMN